MEKKREKLHGVVELRELSDSTFETYVCTVIRGGPFAGDEAQQQHKDSTEMSSAACSAAAFLESPHTLP
jgi:hypothetical protein